MNAPHLNTNIRSSIDTFTDSTQGGTNLTAGGLTELKRINKRPIQLE